VPTCLTRECFGSRSSAGGAVFDGQFAECCLTMALWPANLTIGDYHCQVVLLGDGQFPETSLPQPRFVPAGAVSGIAYRTEFVSSSSPLSTAIFTSGCSEFLVLISRYRYWHGGCRRLVSDCAEKSRLLRDYEIAAHEYARVITTLLAHLHAVPGDGYQNAYQASETRRGQLEKARQALEAHTSEHGC
jgi:hypothetical protein